ncbi:emp24/gp25L/p24 family/GOLD-domain-containing protein [Chytridium lagenaria]|nr:emp24/gp25L/p24 family/GOLD-domain-containing protein [Chytridium lagenaria]
MFKSLLPVALSLLLALLLQCSSVAATNAFQIRVQPHMKECFHEHLEVGQALDIAFQVYDGGQLDIDFWIAAPDERLIHSVFKQTQMTHSMTAQSSGKYQYCFSNQMSSVTQKVITFSARGPDERTRFDEKYKDSKEDFHTPLNEEIRKLSDALHAVVDENNYMIHREAVHRSSHTNSRVAWWSIFETLVLFAVCSFQVYYVRSFFEVKRLI